jgi:hypothetical protein
MLRQEFESPQLLVRNIVAFVFRKPIDKKPLVILVGRQERPIPSTLPCPWSRHSFFDETSTKVSIDKPLSHFLNGLTQDKIRKSRFLLPSFKGEGFEDVRGAQSLSNPDTNKAWLMYSIELYSTECYTVKLGGPPGRREYGSLGGRGRHRRQDKL